MSQQTNRLDSILDDLPQLLAAASEEMKAMAAAALAPISAELDLASQKEMDSLRHLLVRMEQRVSELEATLDRLETAGDSPDS